MRVLLVNAHGSDLGQGGAEKYVRDLVAGLEQRGDAVEILAAFPPRVDGSNGEEHVLHPNDWRESGVRRIRNHLGDLVCNPTSQLAAAVDEARPDVVHTSNLPGITTALWEVCRRLGIPVVHTIHDYYLLCPRVTLQERDGTPCCRHRTFCRVRTARLARWSGAVREVIAVSDHVRRRHESVLPDARFHVVRIPVAPLAGEPLRPPRTPPRTIGYLGTLGQMKGVAYLVEAAPRLAALGYSVQVAGEGRLRPLVEAAAARGELRYVGAVHGEGKRRFVESTDLAVLPSTWEEPGAPPYAVAEWLAAGRPILVSRRGGLEEVAHQLPGAVAMESGTVGIVEAAGALAAEERWRELVASIPTADQRAIDEWVDRHRDIYGLAAAGALGGPDGRLRTSAR
jgi:glycosyltransferase involved in cell wall biosynthesis